MPCWESQHHGRTKEASTSMETQSTDTFLMCFPPICNFEATAISFHYSNIMKIIVKPISMTKINLV
jgi:hypothetical protein